MPDTRRKFDREFREGAVRIVRETGKPIAQVARDLGIHAGTLGNWVGQDRGERGETEGLNSNERARLRELERAEPVKAGETTSHADLMSVSGVGSLIQATVGSFGGWGRRCRNRAGLAA